MIVRIDGDQIKLEVVQDLNISQSIIVTTSSHVLPIVSVNKHHGQKRPTAAEDRFLSFWLEKITKVQQEILFQA